MAWKRAIGFPNASRSCAYCSVWSNTRWAPATQPAVPAQPRHRDTHAVLLQPPAERVLDEHRPAAVVQTGQPAVKVLPQEKPNVTVTQTPNKPDVNVGTSRLVVPMIPTVTR